MALDTIKMPAPQIQHPSLIPKIDPKTPNFNLFLSRNEKPKHSVGTDPAVFPNILQEVPAGGIQSFIPRALLIEKGV